MGKFREAKVSKREQKPKKSKQSAALMPDTTGSDSESDSDSDSSSSGGESTQVGLTNPKRGQTLRRLFQNAMLMEERTC